jgi:hypothetical protein
MHIKDVKRGTAEELDKSKQSSRPAQTIQVILDCA